VAGPLAAGLQHGLGLEQRVVGAQLDPVRERPRGVVDGVERREPGRPVQQ